MIKIMMDAKALDGLKEKLTELNKGYIKNGEFIVGKNVNEYGDKIDDIYREYLNKLTYCTNAIKVKIKNTTYRDKETKDIITASYIMQHAKKPKIELSKLGEAVIDNYVSRGYKHEAFKTRIKKTLKFRLVRTCGHLEYVLRKP